MNTRSFGLPTYRYAAMLLCGPVPIGLRSLRRREQAQHSVRRICEATGIVGIQRLALALATRIQADRKSTGSPEKRPGTIVDGIYWTSRDATLFDGNYFVLEVVILAEELERCAYCDTILQSGTDVARTFEDGVFCKDCGGRRPDLSRYPR